MPPFSITILLHRRAIGVGGIMKHLNTFKGLLLTLLLACTSTVSAHDFEVDGIYYNILSEEDKTVEVTFKGDSYSSYDEYAGSITIPQSVLRYGALPYKVIRIGEDAFFGCHNLTSISIPNSVISIGAGAFGSTAWYDNQPVGLVYAGKVLYKYKGTIPANTNIVIEDGTLGIADEAFYNIWLGNSYNDNYENITSIKLPTSLVNIGESAFYGCSGLTSIVIPQGVNNIGDYAFFHCTALEGDLIIPEGVTKIGTNVFSSCSNLHSVTIPNTVRSIGVGAFSGCSTLTSIKIGDNVEYIYNNAFSGCSSLISIIIPNKISSISYETFSNCSNLTSIVIPGNVRQIGHDAFYGCSNLISVTIGKNVSSIGRSAFGGCNKLQTVVSLAISAPKLDSGVFSNQYALLYYPYGSDYSSWELRTKQECWEENGVLYSILDKTNNTAKVIGTVGVNEVAVTENVIIDEQSYKVTNIASNAFVNGVTSIKIPKTITVIESQSIRLCNTLERIDIDKENPKYDSRDNCIAIIETATNTLVSGCMNSRIPYSVKSIGNKAFYGCYSLTAIDIPNCVTEIGYGAFEGCSGLTSVTIPSSVNKLYCCTFEGCTGLKNLIIEDSNEPLESVLKCNYHASHFNDYFFEDSPIEYMYIGRDLKNYTFNYQDGQWRKTLKTVVFGSGMTTIPNSMFDSCFELSSVTIPNNIKVIGHDAFYYCDNLNGINLHNELTFIGDDAFRGIDFKSITIPKSVTHIGKRVFCENSELESIIVEADNPIYDSREGCNAIIETSTNKLLIGCKSTTIPSTVTCIGESSFLFCKELYTLEIPSSVTSIGNSAFYYCDGVSSVKIPHSVTNIGDYAFGQSKTLKDVFFSSNPTIGANAIPSTATCHLVIDDSNRIDFNTVNSNKYSDVSYTRTISEGKFGTIILPFTPNAKSLENYAFYALAESGDGYMRFEEIATPVANTPYIYTLREGKENVAITGGVTTISSNIVTPEVDGWQTVGSFSNQTIDTSNGNYYALSATDNEINRITKNLTILPYRAYFKSSNASKSALSIYISGTTGVKEISSSEIDGFENGGIFDLSGRKITEPTKGNIYIKDGKKIMF